MTIKDGEKVKKFLDFLNIDSCFIALNENEELKYLYGITNNLEEIDKDLVDYLRIGEDEMYYVCEATKSGFTPLYSINLK